MKSPTAKNNFDGGLAIAVRDLGRWSFTVAATVASTYALDAFATAVGVLLVTSQFLAGFDRVSLLAFLAGTYLIWAAGMRVNLRANWHLLVTTGMSTNVLSKAGFDLFLTGSARSRKIAASAGYVITELVKEIPYYSGAFGVALVSESVSSNEALVFLAGANVGAGLYEYFLAWLTRTFLLIKIRRDRR